MEAVSDTPQSEAISRLAAAVDTVLDVGMVPGDEAEARRLLVDLEAQARRVRAAQVELIDEIDRAGLHAADGHASSTAGPTGRTMMGGGGLEALDAEQAAERTYSHPALTTQLDIERIRQLDLDHAIEP